MSVSMVQDRIEKLETKRDVVSRCSGMMWEKRVQPRIVRLSVRSYRV